MSTERNQTELMELVEALCYKQITPEQTRRLEAIICDDKQARQDYVRYTHMHANLSQLFAAVQPSPAEAEELKALAAAWLAKEQALSSDQPIGTSEPVCVYASNATPNPRRGSRLSPLGLLEKLVPSAAQLNCWLEFSPAVIAALVLITLGFAMAKRWGEPSPVPIADRRVTNDTESFATLQSTAGTIWRGSESPTALGSRLMPGTLQLLAGVAEIQFDSGARILLEGPATLTLQTAMRGFLETGQLVARVPPQATGFTIETPRAKIIDLGTEFGVRVQPDGDLEVHVFEGTVDLATTEAAASESFVRLKAGQARHLDAKETATWQEVAVDEHRFVRKQPPRRVFNTGVDAYGRLLKPGDPDPHWKITTSSDGSFSAPGYAVTTLSRLDWVSNGPNSNWVSITASKRHAGGVYVYETTFDLSGLNPFTAAIVGQFSVDNEVTAVLINGVASGIVGSAYEKFIPFSINRGFIAGVNTLEFVTENDFGELPINAQGLRVEMKLDSTTRKTWDSRKTGGNLE